MAPMIIMWNAIHTVEPWLQKWLSEGVTIEVHTVFHPWQILEKGNFQAAVDAFHGGVDLLNHIPGNCSVVFRMPCCDSMNTPSPRSRKFSLKPIRRGSS